MNDVSPETPTIRRRWKRWVVVGLGALVAYAVIAWRFMPEPQGWLRTDRKVKVSDLFEENGVRLEDVERYSVYSGDSGLGEGLRVWWRDLKWSNTATWLDFNPNQTLELYRAELFPGAHRFHETPPISEGSLLVWKARGKSNPTWLSCPTAGSRYRFYANATDLPPASLEQLFDVRANGKVRRLPPHKAVEMAYEFADGGRSGWGVTLLVDDPRAWMKAAAIIASEEGGWGGGTWHGDDAVEFTLQGSDFSTLEISGIARKNEVTIVWRSNSFRGKVMREVLPESEP